MGDVVRKSVILLIEDAVEDADQIKAVFADNHAPIAILHAVDGQDGLDCLRRQGRWGDDTPRPDLVVVDLNMPRLDGRAFLAEFRRDGQFSAIPVVVLTVSEAESDVVTAYRCGAAGYIVKPAAPERFVAAIRDLANYWLGLVRLPQMG